MMALCSRADHSGGNNVSSAQQRAIAALTFSSVGRPTPPLLHTVGSEERSSGQAYEDALEAMVRGPVQSTAKKLLDDIEDSD